MKSVEPIVSLEWWPSQSNSMCDVDDILLVNSSPVIRGRNVGNNFEVSWFGLQGATYNVWSSEDLQNWSQVGLPWNLSQQSGPNHSKKTRLIQQEGFDWFGFHRPRYHSSTLRHLLMSPAEE